MVSPGVVIVHVSMITALPYTPFGPNPESGTAFPAYPKIPSFPPTLVGAVAHTTWPSPGPMTAFAVPCARSVPTGSGGDVTRRVPKELSTTVWQQGSFVS